MRRFLAFAATAMSAVLLAGCSGSPQATPVVPSVMPSPPSGLESFYSQPAAWSNCGNADCMLDVHGQPLGSHSTNPVPLVVIDSARNKRKLKRTTGTLANVAATFLATLGLAAPSFMDESLVEI
jgi:hypothetical protein